MDQRKRDAAAWNILAVAREGQNGPALRALARIGQFRTTPYPRVLVGRRVEERSPCEALDRALQAEPALLACVSRVIPVEEVLTFERDDVTETLCDAFETMGCRVAARTFHVRAKLRGLKGRLEHPAVERALGGFLIERAADLCRPAAVCFEDPDLIVAVEVVARSVGYAFLGRRLRANPLVRCR